MMYIGRFAPSPTGPLHFGSLVTALASYLDAKQHHGQWLLRIEDLDPPREQAGARDHILKALDLYGLHYDGFLLLQSKRRNAYERAVQHLYQHNRLYACICSRKLLASQGKVCTGQCWTHKNRPSQPHALRLRCPSTTHTFNDGVYGCIHYDFSYLGNCVIQRRDGIFSYQLAVVVDDFFQGITHVIRGADLLSSTPWQHLLFQWLNGTIPRYTHIPLVRNHSGDKLSKQYGATALPITNPEKTLWKALTFLKLTPPPSLVHDSIYTLLQWGIQHWQRPTPFAEPPGAFDLQEGIII